MTVRTKLRSLSLSLALLAGVGCATQRTPEDVREVAAEQPVDQLHDLIQQRRFYEGFLLWPRVEQALARSAGRGTLGREYARMISLTARAQNQDEWRWIMASPRIERRLKVDLVCEIGATE